jgi:hypothetical protein
MFLTPKVIILILLVILTEVYEYVNQIISQIMSIEIHIGNTFMYNDDELGSCNCINSNNNICFHR